MFHGRSRYNYKSDGNETIFFSGMFFACNHPGLISPDDGKINIIVLIKFTVVSVNVCE